MRQPSKLRMTVRFCLPAPSNGQGLGVWATETRWQGAVWPTAWTRIGYFRCGSLFKKQIPAGKCFGCYTNKKESNRTVGREWLLNIARIAQLVERDLAKVQVASSSLVFRSKLWGGLEMVPAWSHKPNNASSILAPATINIEWGLKECPETWRVWL